MLHTKQTEINLNNTMNENELYHFGIQGMKWGIRRYQNPDGTLTDEGMKRYGYRQRRTYKRHLSAGFRNLKTAGSMATEADERYNIAEENYRTALRRPHIFKSKRVADIQKASDNLKLAGEFKSEQDVNWEIAKEIYDSDKKTYQQHVDRMIDIFGDENVSQVEYRRKPYRKNEFSKEVEDIIKTGPTIANVPLVGNLYVSNYIGKRDAEIRRQRMSDKSKKGV